jgi:hypothetical protein
LGVCHADTQRKKHLYLISFAGKRVPDAGRRADWRQGSRAIEREPFRIWEF